MDNFVHLHNHSEYSTLDGFSRITDIVKRVKEIEQPAFALTDHGNLSGCYKFYHECINNDIKPILGIEAYVVKTYDKSSKVYHLTLLAANNTGWKSLLHLFRTSYQHFYYKPRIDFNDLFQNSEGLVCLSGCNGGILLRHIHDLPTAEENAALFKDTFKDNFYIEIMDQKIEDQVEFNTKLREIGKKLKIKTVATNDTHYCNKDDSLFQDYLICDNVKKTIFEDNRPGLLTHEFYIKTREEMPGTEEEKETTLEIADKCNVTIRSRKFLLPKIEGDEEEFVRLIEESIDKFNLRDNEEYLERIREEYKIIRESNLTGYFLVVRDYIKYAESKGILVGPGRGSVGGCLIGYLLGIHKINPIKHKLLFSRFYNAGRTKSLPDIDTDFPEKSVQIVRDYVSNKYGKEKVSHIGTYTILHKKSALKLVCRVLGIDFTTANNYSNIIEDKDRTDQLRLINNSFDSIVQKSERMEGLTTHGSIHAAGIVISPIDLEKIVPIRTENESYVTCWDMDDIEDIGLVKFDFLSLNTLDVINDTLKSANIEIQDIPLDDEATFNTINTTDNVGIFQLSSDGISKVANEIKVKSIDDISVVVALYRPGPIESNLHTEYIERRNKNKPVSYLHEKLESILEETYGIFVYQEQIIKSAMVLANFTETEADSLRKAIGKKLPKLMAQQEKKFIDGCIDHGVPETTATTIWEEIKKFASYSFNRAHSVGYAYITYYTAYLKTHYPAKFMAALLNNNYDKQHKLQKYLLECKKMGIRVVPPSIVDGSSYFVEKDGHIIFGLKGIAGIGEKTAQDIIQYKYKNMEDFFVKFQPSSNIILALAESGAFDEFGISRNSVIQSADRIVDYIKQYKKHVSKKTKVLFEAPVTLPIKQEKELSNEELASKEYERMGAFLTVNPIENIDLLSPELIDGPIFLEGYLLDVRHHITKQKKSMAFLKIITKMGEIEGIIFPKLYAQKVSEIKKNSYIAVKGIWEGRLIINNIWEKL